TVVTFATNTLPMTDFDVAPDGSLWYLDVFGNVQRISTTTSTNRPPTAVSSATTSTTDLAPLTVGFTGNGSSDPDNDPLTYSWAFGDGATGTGKDVSHTYTVNG